MIRDKFTRIGAFPIFGKTQVKITAQSDEFPGLFEKGYFGHRRPCGKPFSEFLKIIHTMEAKMICGARQREFKIDHVVEVCEGGLSYD